MSSFAVKVMSVVIEPHHNADALELARIGNYRSVVRKGQYRTGDFVAYIPEDAILPDPLIAELGLTGRLSGPSANRVKAVKLRGVLSQGICVPRRISWVLGQDVTEELGITKYEPVIPAGFKGELMSVGGHRTLKYDIENFKRFPDVLLPGEEVVMTEKCHGTFAMFAFMGIGMELVGNDEEEARTIISSKGVAARGLAFKWNAEANQSNLYVRTAKALNLFPTVRNVFGLDKSVFILGEIFGSGVQDLSYGCKEPQFRVFDIYVGNPREGRFLNDDELDAACAGLMLPRVPVLYRGPFSMEVLDKYTNGKETVSGTEMHIREGVVIRPRMERSWAGDPVLGELPLEGRVQLKSVSEAYLLRKGNITEFQ